jgi:hypothetical protein
VYGIFYTLGRSLKGTMIAFFMKYPDFVRIVIYGSPSLKQENPFPKKILTVLCGRSCICGSPGRFIGTASLVSFFG